MIFSSWFILIWIREKKCVAYIRESRVHACQDANDAREPVYWLLYHQNRNSMPSWLASPAGTSVRIMYIHGSTHTSELTFCSRMLGIIIYKKPHVSLGEEAIEAVTIDEESLVCIYFENLQGITGDYLVRYYIPDVDKRGT